MTDSQLASIMVNYINRVGHLQEVIGIYIDKPGHGGFSPEQIKTEYRQLKNELREIEDYLSLERNFQGSVLYISAFSPSVREAMAEGFIVPINAAVNFKLFSSVANAYYKLTKYVSLEEWGELI